MVAPSARQELRLVWSRRRRPGFGLRKCSNLYRFSRVVPNDVILGHRHDSTRTGRRCPDHDPDGQRDRPSALPDGARGAHDLAASTRAASRGLGRHRRRAARRADRRAWLLGARARHDRRARADDPLRRRRHAHGCRREHASARARAGDVETIVLSHGHWDHVAGMEGIAKELGRASLPVLIHPEFWRHRRIAIPGSSRPSCPRPAAPHSRARASRSSRSETVVPARRSVLVTGEVDRTTPFETGFRATRRTFTAAGSPTR